MDLFWIILLVVVVLFVVGRSRRASTAQRRVTRADLEGAQRTAEEDVTRFGEELQRLDTEVQVSMSDEAMRQDWQRALDSYDAASRAVGMAAAPDDLRHVTSALEDGRYAMACVLARRDGKPLPQRRPPCFFNPAHGPSAIDVEWAPPGGRPRSVPVCLADADRLAQGAEPDVRTVPQGAGRVPYWNAGAAYSPWAMGYFSTYAVGGLLPAFMLGTLLAPGWDGTPADGFDTGGADAGSGGWDQDGGGDTGGGGYDAGGDFGGGDFGGGDFGGL